jgi:hypothetical protein
MGLDGRPWQEGLEVWNGRWSTFGVVVVRPVATQGMTARTCKSRQQKGNGGRGCGSWLQSILSARALFLPHSFRAGLCSAFQPHLTDRTTSSTGTARAAESCNCWTEMPPQALQAECILIYLKTQARRRARGRAHLGPALALTRPRLNCHVASSQF